MARSTLIIAGALIASLGTALYAATPAQTIAERQDGFKSIGRSMKAVRDELAKTTPDYTVMQNNARTLRTTAQHNAWLFPRRTGPASGVKTGALPIIWTQFSDFRAKFVSLTNAARDLEAAAGTNNVGNVRTALAALGGSCKACHDVYRKKD